MDGYSEMGVISSQMYPHWFDMPEGKEGGFAFVEKRKPEFWTIRERGRVAPPHRRRLHRDSPKKK